MLEGNYKFENFPCISEQPCKHSLSIKLFNQLYPIIDKKEEFINIATNSNYLIKGIENYSILRECIICKEKKSVENFCKMKYCEHFFCKLCCIDKLFLNQKKILEKNNEEFYNLKKYTCFVCKKMIGKKTLQKFINEETFISLEIEKSIFLKEKNILEKKTKLKI